MSQTISLHIGQAGVRLGSTLWELYSLEHEIQTLSEIKNYDDSYSLLFDDLDKDNRSPRALFIDLEPEQIDLMNKGTQKKIFSQNNFISAKDGAANIYSRGYFQGQTIIEEVSNKLFKQVEKCDHLIAFQTFRALGGGTGSGFGDLINQKIKSFFPKELLYNYLIIPSPRYSSTPVDIYNAIFSLDSINESTDIAIVYDNESLYKIIRQNIEIFAPNFKNLNRIISQSVSSINASMRFDNSNSLNLKELCTSLIPFPKIKLLSCSYSPLFNAQKTFLEYIPITQISKAAFQPELQMCNINLMEGKLLSCAMNFRGDIVATEVYEALNFIREKYTFPKWQQTGIKVGINYSPPITYPKDDMASVSRSLCLLTNSTQMVHVLKNLTKKFDTLYQRRAFIHWYLREGLEAQQFVEARENIASLIDMYQEIDDDCNSLIETLPKDSEIYINQLKTQHNLQEIQFSLKQEEYTEQDLKIIFQEFCNHAFSLKKFYFIYQYDNFDIKLKRQRQMQTTDDLANLCSKMAKIQILKIDLRFKHIFYLLSVEMIKSSLMIVYFHRQLGQYHQRNSSQIYQSIFINYFQKQNQFQSLQ